MKISNEQLFEFDFEVSQLRLTLETVLKDKLWVLNPFNRLMESIRKQLLEDDA